MAKLKYTLIKNKTQYFKYCKIVEKLDFSASKSKDTEDEIDLLILLIEKWDDDHNTMGDVDPIKLLYGLMADHKLKAKDLVELLGVSKGYVSDMLNYRKGLSKEVIRKLAKRFSLYQDAFNRPYKLKVRSK